MFAAHRSIISTVIIPKENEKDIKEIPDKILKKLNIVMADHMDEVLRYALVLENREDFLKPGSPEMEDFFPKRSSISGLPVVPTQ